MGIIPAKSLLILRVIAPRIDAFSHNRAEMLRNTKNNKITRFDFFIFSWEENKYQFRTSDGSIHIKPY